MCRMYVNDASGSPIQLMAYVSALPFTGTPMSDMVALHAGDPTVDVGEYLATGRLEATLGLRLIRGRALRDEDVSELGADGSTKPGPVLVTQALADRFSPRDDLLGKTVQVSGVTMTVVGIVERLVVPVPRSNASAEYSIILPIDMFSAPGLLPPYIVVRCAPLACAGALKSVRREVADSPLSLSVLDAGILADARSSYFARENESMKLIGGSAAALLAVTGVGFFGLGSFWVAQRYRQIGIRRALGARRRDIRIYFHAENLAVSILGAVAGGGAAMLLNLSAMHLFEQQRLSLQFAPISILTVVIIGQLAVWIPARDASHVSPVDAMRAASVRRKRQSLLPSDVATAE
jgi:putative ABC transport system permease protein